MKKIKILHCPSDVGGQAWMISQTERKLGYISDNMIFKSSCFNYSSDYNLNFKQGDYLRNFLKAFVFLLKAIKRYDVFHFYFGKSILPFYLDLPILKIFRKKIFFTFQGCDIRQRKYSLNNFEINACKECKDFRCQKKYWSLISFFRLKIALIFANKTFVLNPDLKFYSPHSEIFPYLNIDLDDWRTIKQKIPKDAITILHAPSDRSMKGTKYVIKTIEQLKKQGYFVEFKLLENVKHKEMKDLIDRADIVIDQLLFGWYGALAVEAMALSKPVICYLNKNFFNFVPWSEDIPIVNANSEDLYNKIKFLIDNPEKRKEIEKKSRWFVEKWHNPIKKVQELVKIYEQ
ncbi:MAG: glycosyltransferase [Candidatus Nealsonbacteria bacterium]